MREHDTCSVSPVQYSYIYVGDDAHGLHEQCLHVLTCTFILSKYKRLQSWHENKYTCIYMYMNVHCTMYVQCVSTFYVYMYIHVHVNVIISIYMFILRCELLNKLVR